MAGRSTLRIAVRLNATALLTGAIAFAYLFLISGALLPLLLLPQGRAALDLESGLPAVQGGLVVVLLLAAMSFLRRYWLRPVSALLRAAWLPLVFAALALVSVSWSVDPELSIRRGVAVCGTVLMGMLLVGTLGYRKSVMLVTILLAFIAVGSLVTSVLLPEVGVHQVGAHVGRWRGLYIHKNLLGREMALALGLFLAAAISASGWRRGVWLGLTVVASLLLVQAQSATGIVAAGAAVVVLIVLGAGRGRPLVASAIVTLGLIGAVAAGLAAAFAPERLVGLVNRDLSFTGRTQLWSYVLDRIGERPWLGHGYRAFWGSAEGAELSSSLGWRVVHAHNSWLDVALDLGGVGVVLITWLIARPFVRRLLVRRRETGQDETGAMIVTATLVVAMSDSVLLGPNNLFFLLLTMNYIATNAPAITGVCEPWGEAALRLTERRGALGSSR